MSMPSTNVSTCFFWSCKHGAKSLPHHHPLVRHHDQSVLRPICRSTPFFCRMPISRYEDFPCLPGHAGHAHFARLRGAQHIVTAPSRPQVSPDAEPRLDRRKVSVLAGTFPDQDSKTGSITHPGSSRSERARHRGHARHQGGGTFVTAAAGGRYLVSGGVLPRLGDHPKPYTTSVTRMTSGKCR